MEILQKRENFLESWVNYNTNLSNSQVKFYQDPDQIFRKFSEKFVEISRKLSGTNVSKISRKFLGILDKF